jgi:hypothetical protein
VILPICKIGKTGVRLTPEMLRSTLRATNKSQWPLCNLQIAKQSTAAPEFKNLDNVCGSFWHAPCRELPTMTKTTYHNPAWWSTQEDSAWERTKAAFKRDWDQTKHDFGSDEPDTNQKLGDTIKQAAGKEAIPPRHQRTFEELESAYRFGYGAHSHYGTDYPEWDDELEAVLRRDWEETDSSNKTTWAEYREAIQHGWDYAPEDEEA